MTFTVPNFIDQRTVIITQPEEGTPKSITLDATTNESHENRSLITENPTEEGTLIADHKTVLPFVLNISGILTDTPIDKSIAGGVTVSTVAFGRASKVFAELEEIDKNDILVTIITGLRQYKNMLFEELTGLRPENGFYGLTFNAKLRQIIKVTETGEFVNPVAENVEHTVAGLSSQGVVTPI